MDSAGEPVSYPVVGLVGEPVTDPVVGLVVESVIDPVVGSIGEPVVDLVSEPVGEPDGQSCYIYLLYSEFELSFHRLVIRL